MANLRRLQIIYALVGALVLKLLANFRAKLCGNYGRVREQHGDSRDFGKSVRLRPALTLTATASPRAAAGQVTFYDGTTVLGTKSLAGDFNGQATQILPSAKAETSACV
jgi:hypothetical protein